MIGRIIEVDCYHRRYPTFKLNGLKGRVICPSNFSESYYGVEFFEKIRSGHDCLGYGKNHYCRWINKNFMKRVGCPNSGIIIKETL